MRRTILITIMCAVMVGVLTGLSYINIQYAKFIYSLVSSLMFLGFGILLKSIDSKIKIRSFFSFKRIGLKDIPITIWSSILLISGSFLINYLTSFICEHVGIKSVSSDSLSVLNGNGYVFIVFFIAVIPAIMEEFFFRGAVLSFLNKKGIIYSTIFSAIFFTIVHGLDYYFLTTFYAGIILAVTVNITGSIYISMIIHFINNIMSYILSVYSQRLENAHLDMYLLYSLGFLLLISLYLFISSVIYRIKHENKDSDSGNISQLTNTEVN